MQIGKNYEDWFLGFENDVEKQLTKIRVAANLNIMGSKMQFLISNGTMSETVKFLTLKPKIIEP